MNLPFCDECKAPLKEAGEIIIVRELIFASRVEPPRQLGGLHFCDHKCMTSFVVKERNRPQILHAQ